MRLIDADVFLEYLIFSKHIDSLKCKEVKEAVEMSKVDVLDKIRAEIEKIPSELTADGRRMIRRGSVFRIIDKYKAEFEPQESEE